VNDAAAMKQRLVQQLAKLDQVEAEAKGNLQEISKQAATDIADYDRELAKLRPVLQEWVEKGFQPDSSGLRALAQRYVKLTGNRQNAIYAASIAHGHLRTDENAVG
jgi:hypothetical protein